MKKMRNLAHSEWKLSVMALAALIGTFTSILVVQRELNQTFAIGCLAVYALVVVSNAIYVFYKRKKNNGVENGNYNHE
ncbi:hypothetical protein [Lentibacillus sediminis]|uniref:hypothetical protein n=1 Tax=Lentibacillus sediminis TaxID=1940529 RepID=UPI000C1C467D|nr:hypothetical protein [Lentibacillus sediminis]